MAEYIDKTKLIADGWFLHRTYQQDAHTMMYESKEIADIPSADVAPVVHASWIKVRNHYFQSEYKSGTYTSTHCSNCGVVTMFPLYYCPTCGARMDKEDT